MKTEELRNSDKVQLIDVRLQDDYESEHLVGAKNNCVFEVDFISRLGESAPDKEVLTVVYGANGDSHEAMMAKEKLLREGYVKVACLEGGIEAALSEGMESLKGKPLPAELDPFDGRYEIDLEHSKLEWLGRNIINKHWGTAGLKSGYLEYDEGELVGGECIVDLDDLQCTDLKDSPLHEVLISHLKSDDFFDVEKHPEAIFKIRSAKVVVRAEGSEKLEVGGDLTLRGMTNPIEFGLVSGEHEGKPAAQAAFSIDRTKWGVLYGSGKFFHRLAGHFVNDLLEFQMRILTKERLKNNLS